MIVSHIVAVSENWVIGKDNDLPWNMPDDLAWFHKVTKGHTVIMGRKNYEANGNKALPGRDNIVISRRKDYSLVDASVVGSLEEALKIGRDKKLNEAFIVGGGEIYRVSLPITDRIYLTIIHTRLEGDTTYPQLDMNKWKIVMEDPRSADSRHPFSFTFYILDNPKSNLR